MPMPLRTVMIVLWGPGVAGAAIVSLLALGRVSWTVFALSGAVALLAKRPAGIVTAPPIKNKVPAWPPRGNEARCH